MADGTVGGSCGDASDADGGQQHTEPGDTGHVACGAVVADDTASGLKGWKDK